MSWESPGLGARASSIGTSAIRGDTSIAQPARLVKRFCNGTAIQTLGGAGRIGEAEPAVVGDSVQPLQGCDAFRIGIPRVSPWALLSDPFRVPFPRRLFVWDSVQSHQGPRLWTSVPGTPQGSDRRARGETPGNEIRKRRQP